VIADLGVPRRTAGIALDLFILLVLLSRFGCHCAINRAPAVTARRICPAITVVSF
jgi:hypothetical protein